MRIQMSSLLLLPSLFNAGVLAKHCEQPEGQTFLAADTVETADDDWTLTGYVQLACGGVAGSSSGNGTQGCAYIETTKVPDSSYRFWGSGTTKACFYGGTGGCSPQFFITESYGDPGLTCTRFPGSKAATSFSIVDGTTSCLLGLVRFLVNLSSLFCY